MPLNIPTSASEVEARSKADVQRELEQSNPFLKNSWLGAIVTAAANRIFDFYLQLQAALKENFPDTAVGDFLIRWAAIWGKQRIAASKSNGNVVATGVAGSVVPIGTVMAASGVGDFTSTGAATISDNTIAILTLTRVGQTVTAVTASDHNLADAIEAVISGAAASEYNITTTDLIVTAADAFQYTVAGSPADEGAGASADYTTASVPVESNDFGAFTNLDSGTQLRLQSPIVGVDDTLTVDFDEVGGGTDQETDTQLRARMLDRIQNPVAHFNASDITEKAKEVAGVTRVFVQEITPSVGQVTVYFMRDNDINPIPAGSEVAKVRAKIEEILPANTDTADLFVLAPTGVVVDYTFAALTPNTSTMKTAIQLSLRQFHDERTDVGVNIDEDAYRSAIFNTVDIETGALVETFTLSLPVGDVVIASGEIGILGAVTFT